MIGEEREHQHEHEHAFDHEYWERHWAGTTAEQHVTAANPYLVEETSHLRPRVALDAGSGAGAEAIWLAERGWQVTAADISRTALTAAETRSRHSPGAGRIAWVQADLTVWEPVQRWHLVVTSYAHPSIPQLDLYRRAAGWVAPGGTLLIVAHRHDPESSTHDHPRESSATRHGIVELFDTPGWDVETAREHARRITTPAGGVTLNDVVVRLRRHP